MLSPPKPLDKIKPNLVCELLPGVGLVGAGGVKNFSVGICDGAPSTARSSFSYFLTKTYVVGTQKNHLNETIL